MMRVLVFLKDKAGFRPWDFAAGLLAVCKTNNEAFVAAYLERFVDLTCCHGFDGPQFFHHLLQSGVSVDVLSMIMERLSLSWTDEQAFGYVKCSAALVPDSDLQHSWCSAKFSAFPWKRFSPRQNATLISLLLSSSKTRSLTLLLKHLGEVDPLEKVDLLFKAFRSPGSGVFVLTKVWNTLTLKRDQVLDGLGDACRYGNRSVFQWLHAEYRLTIDEVRSRNVMCEIIESNVAEASALEFLEEVYHTFDLTPEDLRVNRNAMIKAAASRNRICILRWLQAQGLGTQDAMEEENYALRLAAEKGYLQAARVLVEEFLVTYPIMYCWEPIHKFDDHERYCAKLANYKYRFSFQCHPRVKAYLFSSRNLNNPTTPDEKAAFLQYYDSQ